MPALSVIVPVALGVYTALALARTYPLVAYFTTHVPSDLGDPLLTTWIMTWATHALTHTPGRLFDANISYPCADSLAFSDHLLGALPLFAPVYLLTDNPVTAANTVFVLSFVLSALAAFLLALELTGAFWPSLLGGALFGFSPLRFAHVGHVQLLLFLWAPLALLYLDRFLRRGRGRDLAAFGLFYCLQVLAAAYLAFMMTVAVALYASLSVLRRDADRPPLLGKALVGIGLILVVLVPVHLPYARVNRAWEAPRTVGAMVGMSADLQGYLTAPSLTNDWYASTFDALAGVPGAFERRLFPGLVLPLLALLGATGTVTGLATAVTRRIRVIFGTMTLAAIVLSLGPYLVVLGRRTPVPLPYLLLYYVVPGWSGMRVPARFALLAVLAAIPLATLGALRLGTLVVTHTATARTRRITLAVVSSVALALFVVELGAKPLPLVAVPTGAAVPPVYRWLASEPRGPVLELPLDESTDQTYVYLSTVHWQPLVNGESGFVPKPFHELRETLALFPAARAVEYAAALGVRIVVVHTNRLDPAKRARLAPHEQTGELVRRATFGADVAYGIAPRPLADAVVGELAVPDRLPAARDTRLGVLLRPVAARPWAAPRPPGIVRAHVEWQKDGITTTLESSLAVPLAIGSRERAAIPLRVRTPRAEGRYTLRVTIPALALDLRALPIEIRDVAVPPSTAPGALGARYAAMDELRVPAGGALELTVKATNSGASVWLARAANGRGEVGLRWRWLRAGDANADEEATPIRYEVFPGQTYDFTPSITAPPTPGRWILELGLVSDGIAAFADAGTPPLRIPVTVE